MAAQNHVHPNQFKLFMSPSELIGSVTGSGDRLTGLNETMSEMWNRKEKESRGPRQVSKHGYTLSHGSGVYNSIASEGVTSHVFVRPGETGLYMENGHHRVAAAAAVERETGRQQYIPVNYSASENDEDFYGKHYPQNVRKNWVD